MTRKKSVGRIEREKERGEEMSEVSSRVRVRVGNGPSPSERAGGVFLCTRSGFLLLLLFLLCTLSLPLSPRPLLVLLLRRRWTSFTLSTTSQPPLAASSHYGLWRR